MAQTRDIEYRRLVSNLARELNDKDIEQIAYVRLAGKEDTTRYSAAKPCASALDLMKTLENFDVFSLNNIAGLIEVVKDARRNDLVRKIEEYVTEDTERRASQNSSARPLVKKKPARNGGQAAGKADECEGHSSHRAFSMSRGGPHLAHQTRIAQELSQLNESAQDGPPTSNSKSTLKVICSKSKAALQKVSLKPSAEKPTVRETITPSKVEKRQKQLIAPSQLPVKLHSYTRPSKPTSTLPPPPHQMPPKRFLKPPTSEAADDRDRDSGMWTGSSSDDVTEWRKHIPDQGKGSEYQSIDKKDKYEDHEYATPGMPVRI